MGADNEAHCLPLPRLTVTAVVKCDLNGIQYDQNCNGKSQGNNPVPQSPRPYQAQHRYTCVVEKHSHH